VFFPVFPEARRFPSAVRPRFPKFWKPLRHKALENQFFFRIFSATLIIPSERAAFGENFGVFLQ
jgi:hypothetical protein